MDGKDYYEILEIHVEATDREIKESYRRLALQYHPDRNPGDAQAVEHMKRINEAYAVLSDPAKKQRYDSLRQNYGTSAYDRFREGYSDDDIFRGSDINQIFEEFSRAFGFRSFEDIFKEAYGSGYRTFEFRNGGVFGRGFIFTSGGNFNAGPANGDAIGGGTKPGIGARIAAKIAGYAFKKITGIGTERDRYDLLRLTPQQAKEGCKASYRDRQSSRDVVITVPPGVTEGQSIRLKGMGAQNGLLAAPGDLYLKIEITRPFIEKIRSLFRKETVPAKG